MEPEKMYTEVWAAFVLTGFDLDPDQVTALTGITPSKTWRLGEIINPRAIMRYQHYGWRVKSDLSLSADLEEHVRTVLEQLKPAWPVLVELGRRYDVEIACVVRSFGGDRPSMHFDKDSVKRIAELNAALDIDLYVFDDDP